MWTPERIIALFLAALPILIAVGAAVKWAVELRLQIGKTPESPPTPPQAELTMPAPDDHADDAILALRESRDDWKKQAGEYQSQLKQEQARSRSLEARLAACERDRFTTRTKED